MERVPEEHKFISSDLDTNPLALYDAERQRVTETLEEHADEVRTAPRAAPARRTQHAPNVQAHPRT